MKRLKLSRTSRAAGAVMLVCIAAAATAVAASSSSSGSRATTLKIAGLVAQTPDPYFVSMKCGALAAAKKLGNVSLSWQGPVAPSVSQQITALGAWRQLIQMEALTRLMPAALREGSGDPLIPAMSVGVAILVAVAWVVVPLALAARRTATRDA